MIHPPVDTDFFHPDGTCPTASALVVSALVPYKRIEIAIEACQEVGVELTIVGQGPELGRLRKLAPSGVEFLGSRTNEEIRDLYRRAGAVLLPGEEDFGIVPLEAQACGRPVVALGRGGATETVVDGVTGVLVETPTVDGFAAGLRRALDGAFDPAAARRQAEGFSRPRFAAEMHATLERAGSGFGGSASW